MVKTPACHAVRSRVRNPSPPPICSVRLRWLGHQPFTLVKGIRQSYRAPSVCSSVGLEHGAFNPEVGGSSPPTRTMFMFCR